MQGRNLFLEPITEPGETQSPRRQANGNNKLSQEDRPAHDWYRFVLSFPPHLVQDYLERMGVSHGEFVLDPFCGTGTTLVECKKLRINGIGIEANPMAWFASSVKTEWNVSPEGLRKHAVEVAEAAHRELKRSGVRDFGNEPGCLPSILRVLPEESNKLLLRNSISPLPLHKTLVLLGALGRQKDDRFHRHELLALAKAVVNPISNLHFGPEVGVGFQKPDSPVIGPWLDNVEAMAQNLKLLQGYPETQTLVYHSDARNIGEILSPRCVDAVFTSPPYPNEKDYTRTTRLESVLLGFIKNKFELRAFKKGMMRSNTRNVYRGDDDDRWIKSNKIVQGIAEDIEARRIAMGKTSGFERNYAKVTRLYFGGMARHLAELRRVLRPGARLGYVVGDQASYLRVMIRTGQILAEIAQVLGYEVLGLDLFRTRLATATREQLREEVVLLRWPGSSSPTQ